MIVLSGAELVLPDRILSPGTLVIEGDRIVEIRQGTGHLGGFAFHGHYIVPGFVDVHVHGVDGVDALDSGDAISAIAARLPRYGVTAFCPTTVACSPVNLEHVLTGVRQARATPSPRSARVLPAHLESNFISPEYRGAQPSSCIRSARSALETWAGGAEGSAGPEGEAEFDGADILREIDRASPDVGIVTLAPEVDGGVDLIRWLIDRGCRVSLGHSAATYEDAVAAIGAGATQATHLFNRMPPLGHRSPGLAGAVMQAEEVAAEIICDGFHVHPAIVRAAVAAKRPARVMAISDGTAASGLAAGARGKLGGVEITAKETGAYLSDGTLAGSVLTMNRVFRTIVEQMNLSLVDAALMCSTTPARELGLVGYGVLSPDAVADLVVLDSDFSVVQTYIGGQLAYTR
jgi:N-acetylglucosamine-6-phosphate deacetylase